MNFSEPLETVAVTFICGSENHKSHDKFFFIFSISIKFFLWIYRVAFHNFQKLDIEAGYRSRVYFVTPLFSGAEMLF